MSATYQGGCHCGAVRFEVTVVEHEALDCNCSMCTKKGFLHIIVPPERFRLRAGEDRLATYAFNTGVARHHFCATCGVHPFYRPRSHPGWYDVNARCLDDDALARFTVRPFDGKNWEQSADSIAGRPLRGLIAAAPRWGQRPDAACAACGGSRGLRSLRCCERPDTAWA